MPLTALDADGVVMHPAYGGGAGLDMRHLTAGNRVRTLVMW